MFREQYNQLNSQINPDENLLCNTIGEAERIERKPRKRNHLFFKLATALVSVFLCFSLVMPALAATIEPIYELMYMVSPTIAQSFMPVQKSDEQNGIRMEVVSAYIHENTAKIYITMQDLTDNRIDETTDLFDSYSINRPFDSSAYCERVGYDKDTGTVTFLISIEEWGNADITGDKITFSVKEFLSHKQTYDNIEIPLSLSSVEVAEKTQKASNITGWGGVDASQFDEENPIALVPQSPMSVFPVDGIDLTGIGYIQGKLHIQTAVSNNSDKDNHGFFYLNDRNGNKITTTYSFYYVNQYEQSGKVSYCNYVFDIPQNEIANYTLHGDFVTSGMITKGNWRVTFPLERQSGSH